MRVLLSDKSRKDLFDLLMKKHSVKNLAELSKVLQVPYKTLNHWRYDYKKYLPGKIAIDYQYLEIKDIKPDNWGQIKGGKQLTEKKIENLKRLWHDPKYLELRKRISKNAINNLINGNERKFIEKAIKTKLNKRENVSKKLEIENNNFFINNKVTIDNSSVRFSNIDNNKRIILPNEMTPELAEEIGVHLGDGCLSFNKRYFSVKTNKKEMKYMQDFLIPLYKKLYNINIKLMILKSVVGFEIYSQAIFDFKNKSLNIHYGNKVEKIRVPREIINSRNKEVYRAFIRGLFDTDGCVHINKSKNNYPKITFTIKSQELIKQTKEMLEKLGFIPYAGKWKIDLNGRVMLQKWVKEINSNNPKNLDKLQQACSVAG